MDYFNQILILWFYGNKKVHTFETVFLSMISIKKKKDKSK